ncbi:MAG: hypothetical protein GWN55_13580 [Phycisphaerae bacterium]|nr:hypothetical protein [Phycisphaerae bacterium]NIP52690.1 hypothetical protein [Phycisphaerae bacterium]NIS50876.1 hypothetical protein [Phycisphaerae bacterium]NIV02326.1 hypothetical protein [Phycisphaerae bacterium]NIW98055.1 hypothetical protein [Phycisphaerae bacterium]
MKTRKLLVVTTGIIVCVIIIWSSKSIQGSPKTYEVHPQINLPGYGTDALSAIDAYERLMDRYMALTERNIVRVERDLGTVIRKLDSIDRKLTNLSARMSGIEKALGIRAAGPAVKKRLKPESVDEKNRKEGSPSP